MDKTKIINTLEHELASLMSKPGSRRSFLAALPILLAACAAQPHRQREGDNTGQDTRLTVADEQRMSDEYLPQMRKEYPQIKNDYVQKHITQMGQKIVHDNGLHNNPYQYSFDVVDAKMINAFALPAGKVFITTPLIKATNSEAELSGVIGHEIGHIKARHTAERLNKAEKQKTKSVLLGVGGAILGGVVGAGVAKLVCDDQDRECFRRIAIYGGLAGGAGGLLIQKFAFMANSREDEMEADRIGFKSAMNTGYHPDHVGRFYQKLLDMETKRKQGQTQIIAAFTDALSTHPPSKERVAQQQQLANEFAKQTGKINTPEFDKVKSLLT